MPLASPSEATCQQLVQFGHAHSSMQTRRQAQIQADGHLLSCSVQIDRGVAYLPRSAHQMIDLMTRGGAIRTSSKALRSTYFHFSFFHCHQNHWQLRGADFRVCVSGGRPCWPKIPNALKLIRSCLDRYPHDVVCYSRDYRGDYQFGETFFCVSLPAEAQQAGRHSVCCRGSWCINHAH